mmetsp:Transcript_46953/g.133973  ORF Transcript_46953/g.133973 Transcript_46953/m.133973 type:complete len:227 (+) Transcript_46953:255-935(+)
MRHCNGYGDVHRDDAGREQAILWPSSAGTAEEAPAGAQTVANRGHLQSRRLRWGWGLRPLRHRCRGIAGPVARSVLRVAGRAPAVPAEAKCTAGELQVGRQPCGQTRSVLWIGPVQDRRAAALIIIFWNWRPRHPGLRQTTQDLLAPLEVQSLQARGRRQGLPAAHAAAQGAVPGALLVATDRPSSAHSASAGALPEAGCQGWEHAVLPGRIVCRHRCFRFSLASS